MQIYCLLCFFYNQIKILQTHLLFDKFKGSLLLAIFWRLLEQISVKSLLEHHLNSGINPYDTAGAQCDNVLTVKKSFHSTTWQPLASDLFLAPTLDMTRSWTKPQNYPSKSVCTQCALNVSVKWMMYLQSASRTLAMPQKPLLEHCLAPFRRAKMSS